MRLPDAAEPAQGRGRAGVLRWSVTAGPGWISGHWALAEAGEAVAEGMMRLEGEVPEQLPDQLPEAGDWALFAALPAALRHGGTLHLDGPASRRALADAAEFARAWESLRPAEGQAPRLSAASLAEAAPWHGRGTVLAACADGTVPADLPPCAAITTLLVPGTGEAALRQRAQQRGWRIVTLVPSAPASAPGTQGLHVLASAALRAAALHLLAGAGRTGLLVVEPGEAPRPGGPASPAQAAAFLSGGAMEVVPLLPSPLAAPRSSIRQRPITAWFEQAPAAGGTRRSLILEGLAERPPAERVTMWWEMPGEPALPDPPVLDQMVAAAVLPALARGQDLVVKGPLSRLGALNLALLSATRAAWGAPAPRGAVAVEAATLCEGPGVPPPARAVLTFSGGADAFYSLLWRTGPDRPVGEPPLTGAVLSLGFDIPLTARAAFEAHRARLAPVLAARGVALHVVVTNARALGLALWEPAAMPMIASALSQLSHLYGTGLLGGGRPYPLMTLPMIQSPLLDRALSGGWFAIATDAGAIGRSDKIALIAKSEDAVAALRVCYDEASADFSRNCGTCPKCLRTMLNFHAVGVTRPACFAQVPPVEELVELPFWKHDDVIFSRDVLDAAARFGTEGAWSRRLAARADAWRPPPVTLAGRARAKLALWAGRMAEDPLGTPGLAARKLAARMRRARGLR
jgi:hypothetical protein